MFIIIGLVVVAIIAVNVLVALGAIKFTDDYIKGVAHDKYPFY